MNRIAETTSHTGEGAPVSGRWRHGWKIVGAAVAAVVVFVVGGFFVFLSAVSQYAAQSTDRTADAIVVLTGGQSRIDEAFRLLSENRGRRLLISGVNPVASRAVLRKTFDVDEAHFSCCVDVDRKALDTTGNAAETARWAHEHGYRSLIVVTNDYHMPRSLLEMRRTMGDVELLPHAVVNGPSGLRSPLDEADRYRVLLEEYLKFSAAKMRALVSKAGSETPTTQRAGLNSGA